jgi:hypothetical protein
MPVPVYGGMIENTAAMTLSAIATAAINRYI